MAHQDHRLSREIAASALTRYTSPISPYGDDDFRAALLKGQDAGYIMMGTIIDIMDTANGHGRSRWDRAKQTGPPFIVGGGLVSIIVTVLKALA